MGRPSMAAWVKEAMVPRQDDNAKVSMFVLVHHRGNERVELKNMRLGGKQWDPADIAEMFENTAETFSGGIPGVQQFTLEAYFEGEKRPTEQYPFRKNGESDAYGLGTETPDQKGFTQQMMRHFEANHRISVLHSEQLFDRLLAMNDMLMKENHSLRKEQHDTIELAQELVMRESANQHAHNMEILKMKKSMKDRETALRLLPAITNRVMGREIFPQATADSAIIDHLVETLSGEQIERLSGILTPAQWAPIADRMVEAMKKKEDRSKEEKQLEEAAR